MSNGALDRRVFTIGHSNHPFETFLGLLTEHQVEAVVDTRSYPRSKFAPQYDSAALSGALREQGVPRLRLALLCSEENPSICHRRLLIARVLREHGIAVQHIRADGSVESEEEL